MRTTSKKLLLITLGLASLVSAWSNNVQISNVTFNEVTNNLSFDISWDNAFYINDDWSDHVFIFAKYKNANGSAWERVLFEMVGHSDNSASVDFDDAHNSALINGDRVAMAAFNESTFVSGSQSAHCTANLSTDHVFINPSFRVFAIEMISISTIGNDGYYGDGISTNRFHKGSDANQPYFLDYDFSTPITVGTGAGDINTTHPAGIPVTSIPASIFRTPNNIMKYEISQQQYVDFLNSLNRTAQNKRTGTDISGTTVTDVYVMSQSTTVIDRNGIRCDASLPVGGPITFYCDYNGNGTGDENDDGQNIAANYLSGEDLFAYLDWAGLDILNELEYEHICRGTYLPVPHELAWGHSGFVTALIPLGPLNGTANEEISGAPLIGPLRTSQFPMRCGAAATATTNRETSGASAWGIMELSGNVGELVIALRDAASFVAIYDGDGQININGTTDELWPQFIAAKGGYISGVAESVSYRTTTSLSYTSRSPYYGGRGGY